MPDMQETYSGLHPEKAEQLTEVLNEQAREAISFVSDLEKRLTNTNFLTNGGGAVETLAFLRTGADLFLIKLSLLIFTAGVIATGIELRALLIHLGLMARNANERLAGFLRDELTVQESARANVDDKFRAINEIAGSASRVVSSSAL